MGLNEKAQKEVDDQIAKLWSCFKAGMNCRRDDEVSAAAFTRWLEVNEPMHSIYFDAEKLK